MIKYSIKRVFFAACMLLFCIVAQAQTSSNPVGMWTYNCPEAPYEYSTGKAEFKLQDDKLMLVMFVGGTQGQPVAVTKTDDGYLCRFSIDYFDITIILKPDGENLKGTISSDDWELAMTMKPEKKEQSN